MNKTSSEADRYRDFVLREIPIVADLFYDSESDMEPDAIYEYIALKMKIHFAPCPDSDEIRDILSQDPEMTEEHHTLATLFFAQAASDLQITLIENSRLPTHKRIGSIVGIDVPEAPPEDAASPKPSVDDLIALYRALPKDKQMIFGRRIDPSIEMI